MKIAKKVIAAVILIAMLAGLSVIAFAAKPTMAIERKQSYDKSKIK